MRLVTPDQARDLPILRNGVAATVRHYYGTTGMVHTGPQSFLLENPNAGARIEPHFHDSDQFQVIIGGDGKVGVHDAAPVVFPYADAFAPYGPIVAGTQGISFFTMRATAVGGVFNVPGARHLNGLRSPNFS